MLDGTITHINPADVEDVLGNKAVVVGGTAWVFAREELQQTCDYLFIDEAGQFSLANTIAVGQSATNMVMVGDQMQLSQPIQGAHPGESGLSSLDYLLNGHSTIPSDFGVFLNVTYRLHPDVCGFISGAVYEDRLHAHDTTSARTLLLSPKCKLVSRPTGVQYLPVHHEGNTQCSDEEVAMITKVVKELLASTKVIDGQEREITANDILIVSPYNMQVRRLQHALGDTARVGTVDKFQGQEALAVVVSMSASSIEDSPRGAEFLLDPNRLNVAVSRAQCLSIVVGSPAIMAARCGTVEQMKLVNLFCHLVDYSQAQEAS